MNEPRSIRLTHRHGEDGKLWLYAIDGTPISEMDPTDIHLAMDMIQAGMVDIIGEVI